MKRLLMVGITAVLLLGFVTACDGADEFDPRLLETWAYENVMAWTYEFNADGTGLRGQGRDISEFTWSTRNNNSLRINPGRGYQNETWDYTISNGVLRLEGASGHVAGVIFSYYMVGHNPELVDTWVAPEFGMTITFNAGGTAQITDWLGDTEVADWFSTVNRLVFDVGTADQEEWDIRFTADGLIIDNRHVAGMEIELIREADFVPPEIEVIGMWEWDEDYTYVYVFNEDGTGTRGFGDDIESFTWITMHGSLIINEAEVWDYSVENDVLTLTIPGVLTFRYIRIA